MKSVKELVGLPILENKSGQQIGEVQDVYLTHNQTFIQEFYIANDVIAETYTVLAFCDIVSIGDSGIIVEGREKFKNISGDNRDERVLLCKILDLPVMSEKGDAIGKIIDLFFDEITGEVKQYQISGGTLADFLYGYINLPIPEIQLITDERVILPESALENIQEINQ